MHIITYEYPYIIVQHLRTLYAVVLITYAKISYVMVIGEHYTGVDESHVGAYICIEVSNPFVTRSLRQQVRLSSRSASAQTATKCCICTR